MIRRIVLFGDPLGIPQVLRVIGPGPVVALVGASIRPNQHFELEALAAEILRPLLIQPPPGDDRYGAFIDALAELEPDLYVVNSYSMILKPELLALPRRGAVNVHGALLPQYRGASVTEWALINEESETGTTLHVMDAGIDTGPIIAQARVAIRFEDTWIDTRRRANEATQALLQRELPRILEGNIQALPQDNARARYFRRRGPDDGRFSWDLTVRSIYNLVRALVHPHPGARYAGRDGRLGLIDTWHSIAAIAAMKYAPDLGGHRLEGRSRALRPMADGGEGDRREANRTVTFQVSGPDPGVGHRRCRLADIDYELGCAVLETADQLGIDDERAECVALMRAFARDELRLTSLPAVDGGGG